MSRSWIEPEVSRKASWLPLLMWVTLMPCDWTIKYIHKITFMSIATKNLNVRSFMGNDITGCKIILFQKQFWLKVLVQELLEKSRNKLGYDMDRQVRFKKLGMNQHSLLFSCLQFWRRMALRLRRMTISRSNPRKLKDFLTHDAFRPWKTTPLSCCYMLGKGTHLLHWGV